ncbi:MAG: YfhO family protein, partial [Lachnospiraceae bacterium]|nr:YfhO family protein [Candidatus Equihabitans merdae]
AIKGCGKLARLIVLFLTLISVLGLAMPLVSKLFTMVEGNQRFGFILCLLECLAIGAFVKGLITESSPAPPLAALLGTPVVVALCFAGIFLGRQKGFYQLSPKMLLMTAAFFVLYEIIFFIYYLMLRRRQAVATEAKASANISRGNAFILTMLLGLAFCELFLTNNVTVNDRIYLPTDAFETSYYNDGSQISLEAIKAADGDLYRLSHPRETDPALYGISATADFMFANEGSVNNYNGTTSYTNTLPASLSTYGSLYLSDLGKTNFFILNYDNYYLYTLMGGRYIISENDNENVMSTDTDLYDSTAVTSANGLETIFKNDNALPFGYLYENELKDYDNFKASNALQRGRLVTQNYFYTDEMMSADENASSSNAAFSLAGSEEFKISDQIVSTNDCNTRMDGDNLVVEATGADPFILCQIPQVPEGQACFLDLSISPDTAVAQNLQVFFATDTIGLSADFFKNIRFTDEVTEFLTLLPENCQLVRIDTTPGTVVAFDVANLTVCDPASDLANLKHSAISNISFSNHNSKHTGIYQATVDVKNDTAMLAVPLPYSNKWQATIDGNPATVENINGGILGVPVEKGTHEVTLVYATPLIKVGMLISLATCLLFIALYILVCRRR